MRSQYIRSFLLCVALVFSTASFPDDRSVESPQEAKRPNIAYSSVFSQVIVYGLPEGWKLLHSGPSPDGSTYTLGYGQEGASPTNWTELITITGFKDMAKNPKATPAGVIEHLARHTQSYCPERTIAISGGNVIFGSKPGVIAVVGCGKLPVDVAGMRVGEGNVSLHIVVRGDNDMYAISRLRRVDAYEPQSQPVTPDVFERLVKGFLPIGICEVGDSPSECQPKLGGKK